MANRRREQSGGWGRNGRTALHVNAGRSVGTSRSSLGEGGGGAAAPQQSWPVVRVGATGRHELSDTTQAPRDPAGVRASIVSSEEAA